MSLPFDRMHLSSFTGGDMELERSLLLDFHRNALTHIEHMEEAIGQASWNDCAHRLKGAASGIGMRSIAEICRVAEEMDAGQSASGAGLITQIRSELAMLSTYLEL